MPIDQGGEPVFRVIIAACAVAAAAVLLLLFQPEKETQTENEVMIYCYKDADGDGFGNEDIFVRRAQCPDQHVPQAGDCDDLSKLVHPDAEEQCDGVDNNCDGITDYLPEFRMEGDSHPVHLECESMGALITKDPEQKCLEIWVIYYDETEPRSRNYCPEQFEPVHEEELMH